MKKTKHVPVLLKRSIELLNVIDGVYVDCTLGGGGHVIEIARRLKKGKIVAFEVDQDATIRFRKRMSDKGWKRMKKNRYVRNSIQIIVIRENFSKLSDVLASLHIEKVQGVLLDLGLSSDQIEDPKRGFSYMKEGILDMRMDQNLQVSAKDLVNGLYMRELESLFRKSDEPYAKRIAQKIIAHRKLKPITHNSHLVQIIQEALPSYKKGKRYTNRGSVAYWIKPAMRVFQALRIAVNSELSSLRILLPQVLGALHPGGRFVGISFHSGEDRIIKEFIKSNVEKGLIKDLTKRPIKPTASELKRNNQARSAKMRYFEKK